MHQTNSYLIEQHRVIAAIEIRPLEGDDMAARRHREAGRDQGRVTRADQAVEGADDIGIHQDLELPRWAAANVKT